MLKRVVLGAERTTPMGTFCDERAVIRSNLYDRNFGSGYDVKESTNSWSLVGGLLGCSRK